MQQVARRATASCSGSASAPTAWLLREGLWGGWGGSRRLRSDAAALDGGDRSSGPAASGESDPALASGSGSLRIGHARRVMAKERRLERNADMLSSGRITPREFYTERNAKAVHLLMNISKEGLEVVSHKANATAKPASYQASTFRIAAGRLTRDVLHSLRKVDRIIDRYALKPGYAFRRRKGKEFDFARVNKVRQILRLGVFELVVRDSPSHVGRAMASLAERMNFAKASGFVRVFMDRVTAARDSGEIAGLFPAADPAAMDDDALASALALEYSHSDAIVRSWLGRYGLDATLAILRFNNASCLDGGRGNGRYERILCMDSPAPAPEDSPLHGKGSAGIAEGLRGIGWEVLREGGAGVLPDGAFWVARSDPIDREGASRAQAFAGSSAPLSAHAEATESLLAFGGPLFYLRPRDLALLWMPEMADPKPGDRVLVVGALTFFEATRLGKLMEGRGVLVNMTQSDGGAGSGGREGMGGREGEGGVSASKQANLVDRTRAYFDASPALAFEATTFASFEEEVAALGEEGEEGEEGAAAFDCVVYSARSSLTGAIPTLPHIKVMPREALVAKHTHEQQLGLQLCAALLKDGGRLVYHTRSLEREDNEDAVEAFVAAAGGAVAIDPEAPHADANGFVNMNVQEHGAFGHFFARLIKKGGKGGE